MPPALSEDESSASENEIPARTAPKQNGRADVDESEDDEDEEGEGDSEEYIVERIMSHAFDEDGTIRYEVKWLGYEKLSDRTWEPEENLATAQDSLDDYFKTIGGRPSPPEIKPRKQRKRKLAEPAIDPANGRERGRKKGKTSEADSLKAESTKKKNGFPDGSWEDYVMNVDTVEEQPNPATGERERYAYLNWNDGRKTQHKLAVANQKCPQKMLRYYEQHLVFKTNTSEEPSGDES